MKSDKDLILVVDDDRETLQLLKMALERANFQVMTAASWEEVANRVESTYRDDHPIDLIVLDLMMPGRSGFDIFRSLKNMMVSMPPVIMLTAVTGIQQRIDARDLGVTKYLTKPTTPSKLIVAIKDVLTHSRKGKPQDRIRKFPPKQFNG
jgi:DNA-binding response OmpR family regulator